MNFVNLAQKHKEKYGEKETVALTGNTYAFKEEIKAAGGVWYVVRNEWRVPKDQAEKLQNLIDNAQKQGD